ncbi:MAG: lipoprotein signal peptidase [Cyclobacteriaceae bacterium]
MGKYTKYYLLTLAIVILDQVSKLLVANNMELNSEFPVLGDWFYIHYLLNPGFIFGLEIDWAYGKVLLTSFRLVAAVGIAYYLYYMAKKSAYSGLLWCLALILAGAIGNVIDSVFYGVLLGNAPPNAVTPWFNGQVVDLLYFPLVSGTYPEWFPIVGSDSFAFFRPVFNLADSSIFLGVVFMLFLRRNISKAHQREE